MNLVFIPEIQHFTNFQKLNLIKKKTIIFSNSPEIFYLAQNFNFVAISLDYDAIKNAKKRVKVESELLLIKTHNNSYESDVVNEIYFNLNITIQEIFKRFYFAKIFIPNLYNTSISLFNFYDDLEPKGIESIFNILCKDILLKKGNFNNLQLIHY